MTKTYQTYKDSGVQWIGQIPEHWSVCHLWWILEHITTGLNPRDNFKLTMDDDFYYVTIANFKDGKLYLDDKCDRINRDAWQIIQERSLLQKGDILFASISQTPQAYVLKENPINWNINESVFKFRFKKDIVDSMFAYYLLTCETFYNAMRSEATGATFQSIKQYQLKLNSVPLPSLSEQQAIAEYLDKKTAKIDESVAALEEQKGDLQKYRAAVISEAVTRGLDAAAKMKDSSVDWIGEIPEGWSFTRLKHLTSKIGSGVTPSGGASVYQEDGILFIRSQNVHVDGLRLEDVAYISEDIDNGMQNSRVQYGDVLLNITGASIGRCSVFCLQDTCANVNQHVCIVRPIAEITDSKYLQYVLNSKLGQTQIAMYQTGGNREGLNFEQLKNFLIPEIALSEQQAIAEYLDKKTAKIDESIALIDAQIADLQAYRSTVISEAVTGKVKVS